MGPSPMGKPRPVTKWPTTNPVFYKTFCLVLNTLLWCNSHGEFNRPCILIWRPLRYETYTGRHASQKNPRIWLSGPHEHPWGAAYPEPASGQRTSSSRPVTQAGMLPAAHRLQNPSLFKRALGSAGVLLLRTPYYTIIGLPHWRDDAHLAMRLPRIGLVVSRKVDKRATRRNRLKRQLRHAFRALLPTLDPPLLHPWAAWIVLVRPTAVGQPYSELVQPLLRQFPMQLRRASQPFQQAILQTEGTLE